MKNFILLAVKCRINGSVAYAARRFGFSVWWKRAAKPRGSRARSGGFSRLWRLLSRLPRFLNALNLLKNRQATQANGSVPSIALRAKILPFSLLHFLCAFSSDSFRGKGSSLKYIDGDWISLRNDSTAFVSFSSPVIFLAICKARG